MRSSAAEIQLCLSTPGASARAGGSAAEFTVTLPHLVTIMVAAALERVTNRVSRPLDPHGGSDNAADVTSDPEGTSAAPGSEPLHREWAHLRLIEEIGRGGFGRVFRAWDTTLAREVALKLVRVSDVDPEASSLVLEEGRMLARVRHPNVVTVYGALQIGAEVGLWMELVRGRSLADVVRADGPRGPEEAAVIGLSVCRALAAVHAAGLVHRDVKAHNVMRESGGRIVLMDFGAGRDTAVAEPLGWSRAPGTPAYMAPEVIAGEPATRASDLYSVGVLLYFLVTRRYPFEGRTLMEIAVGHGTGRRRLLADERPDLPDRFIRIVERALATNPAERYLSAGAIVHELADMLPAVRRQVQEEEGVEAHPVQPSRDVRTGPDAARSTPSAAQPLPTATPVWPGWLRRGGLIAAGAAIVPWTLGLLTSIALNNSLGRPASFAGDSVMGWWGWGMRILIPPTVYMTAGVLGLLLVRSSWRVARQLLPSLDRLARGLSARTSGVLRESGLADLAIRAQLLLLVQFLGTAAVLWWFWPVFVAQYTIVSQADPATTAPLQSEYAVEVHRQQYGIAVDVLVLVMGAAWLALTRERRRSGLPAFDASAMAGGTLLALSFLAMWAVPYRVTWFNEAPRVQYEGQRCFLLGQREENMLLHCPDMAPPRNRVVRAGEVQRLDVIESIFTPAGSRQSVSP
jgi:serine/threonine-protein kinase